ncbi:MAG: hypothetical protein RL154_922 [Pseudomonadota bacterium]
MDFEFSRFSQDEINLTHQTISKNVRRIRESKGIKQLELALEIDIKSVAFYSNCENNKYNKHFNVEHLYKISKVLEVDICEFFKLED